MPKNSSSKISISRAGISISRPRRAASYARIPSTCTAEKSGGVCIILPFNFGITDITISTVGTILSRKISRPVISSVSVSKPKTHENKSSFLLEFISSIKGIIFVALPIAIGSTPDAIGSSVPICPNFLVSNMRAMRPPAVLENRPDSLSKIINPSAIFIPQTDLIVRVPMPQFASDSGLLFL